MITAADIKQQIAAGLPDATIEVLGDDGQHFEARVASPSFEGKSLIAQHKMVYATLGDSFENALHALAIKTTVS
jgi:stress-induced morphogen